MIWRLLPTIKRTGASRNFDYLGGLIFTIAIGFLLVGLTNKLSGDWTDPTVGGFIAIGLLGSALFAFVESRAKEPIVPLDLWRNRTYASSIISTFLVSFGFFGAIIFLPRWFQVVRHESATSSGYLIFPMLIGLIGSSIVAGALVSRTGKYKAIILAALVSMTVGIALMTQLRADTPYPALFFWMFIAGLGIGPTLSVFTIIVQNAVPFSKLGVATSNLTFFRQIGGSVGLAIAGTQFGTALRDQLPAQTDPSSTRWLPRRPRRLAPRSSSSTRCFNQLIQSGQGIDLNNQTGVGQSFGTAILQQVPAAFQSAIQPFVPQFDQAFNNAMSLAIAQTFWIAVADVGRRVRGGTVHARAAPPGNQCRTRSGSAGRRPGSSATTATRRRLTFAPPLGNGPGSTSSRGRCSFLRYDRRRDPRTRPHPRGTRRARHRRCALRGGARRRRAAARGDATRLPRATWTSSSPTPRMASSPSTIGARTWRRPLSIGQLDGCVVACPLHEGQFDLCSGDPVRMPTTGGLDPDGVYHPTWSPAGLPPKTDPPGLKAEARRLTRVRRFRYYPVRVVDGRIEVALPG